MEFILLLGLSVLAHSSTFTIIKQSSVGDDIVECVDIYNQPAFGHELLRSHKIQTQPSEFPTPVQMKGRSKWETLEARVSTAKCPEGTIPRKNYTGQQEANTDTDVSYPHEYAVGSTKILPKMYGAKATLSVWRPTVEKRDELSLSQIWITWGDYQKNDLSSIEVGWQVLPELYQDNKPRLFIYWTSDAYISTGCYNLLCPGFIQTSSSIILGGTITPVSAFEGDQYEIAISIWKDQKHGNWWLSLGSNQSLVGYWPAEILTNLTYARNVQWGGEIVDTHSFGRHTSTQMGSGHFPNEGFSKVSYTRNLEIVDNNNSFQSVQEVTVRATNSKFYDIKQMYRDDWGSYILFGGPGFSLMHSGVSSPALSFFFFHCSFIIFLSFSLLTDLYFLVNSKLQKKCCS